MRTEYPPDIERLSAEGYLVRECAAEYKSDYVYGRVRAMSVGSYAHGAIAMNIGATLTQQLDDKPCQAVTSEVRVQADGLWVVQDIRGLHGVVSLPSIECTLPLARVYHKIELETT